MTFVSLNPPKHVIVQLIDAAIEEDAEKEFPFRPHLGGSMIGEPCERKLVYSFRWVKKPSHKGRMLRLFQRGHKEEENFVRYLRRVGANVREFSERLFYHPESDSYFTAPWDDDSSLDEYSVDVTGDSRHVEAAARRDVHLKQWRILDVDGHFGGSLDGIADNIPGMPDLGEKVLIEFNQADEEEDALLEFKTHNYKSFSKLVAEGVKASKPMHWYQMQIYMHKRNLKRALYMAVNKNDDDLHAEWVDYDPAIGPKMLEKAERVIRAKKLPPRIGPHAAWADCKFCEFSGICHGGAPILKNCRSCAHSTPVEDGQWKCDLWNAIIPGDVIPVGCDSYKVITD